MRRGPRHDSPLNSTPPSVAAKLLETADIQDKLKKIRLLILDIDGVMTDGRVFWLEGHGWTRHFHVKDGYGLKILMKAGIQVAVISGGDSKDVRTRMEHLKIEHVFLGDEDKLKALLKIQEATGLAYEEMAFMGDDLFDIPVIEKVGFSATVPHAVDPVKERVHYITESLGGWGSGPRGRRRDPEGSGPWAVLTGAREERPAGWSKPGATWSARAGLSCSGPGCSRWPSSGAAAASR